MLDPKELRIGNILQSRDKDGDGSIIVVKEFSLGGINPFVSQAGYEYEYSYEKTDYYDWFWGAPIELSTEWLEKLGFIKEESSDDEEREIWSYQIANQVSLYYDKAHDEDQPWYIASFDNNNLYQQGFWNQPKYVHQVQNLVWSLSGEELTIKNN